jgi:MFS family permease
MILQKLPAMTRGLSWFEKVLALRGNIRVFSAVFSFTGASMVMVNVLLQPYMLSLGASMTFVGLFVAMGGRQGLISALAQPLGGWLSDKKGRKPLILFGNIQFVMALAFMTLAGVFNNWLFFVPAMVFLGFFRTTNPALNAAIAESVKRHERSMAYSVVMFFNMLPAILISAAVGLMADAFGFLGAFLIGMLLQVTSTLLVLGFMKETIKISLQQSKIRLAEFMKTMVIPGRKLRSFILIMASDAFFWGIGAAILFGLLNKTYNFSSFQLGIMWSVLLISLACSQLIMGKLVQKYGCKKFLMLSEVIGIFLMTGWLSFKNFEAFALLQVPYGLVISAWVPAMNTFIANQTAEENRAEAIGKLAAIRGLISFPAPYIGGFLYDARGFQVPITTGLIGIIFTLLLIWLFIHEPESISTKV